MNLGEFIPGQYCTKVAQLQADGAADPVVRSHLERAQVHAAASNDLKDEAIARTHAELAGWHLGRAYRCAETGEPFSVLDVSTVYMRHAQALEVA